MRENDEGDLVVTKGDKYDVREKEVVAAAGAPGNGGASAPGVRPVRNLGKPVELASRYYVEGADEVRARWCRRSCAGWALGAAVVTTPRHALAHSLRQIAFLNITAFRGEPLGDAPMLAVLETTSRSVFVPLMVRG